MHWNAQNVTTWSAWCATLALAGATLAACGDDSSNAGRKGATSSTSSTSASTSSAGGSGGSGGAGGGAGGSGGAAGASCLDASMYAPLFSVADATLCAVAMYKADAELTATVSPTWGRHGGPLLAYPRPGGAVDLVRLTPPEKSSGSLSKAEAMIDAGVPDGSFLGAQAVDLPFFSWTAISWTHPFPKTDGQLVLIDGNAVAKRYDVNGFFAASSIAGRLLHTGLSPIGTASAGANGLYAADSCGASGQNPRLMPEGDASCAAPIAIATWGDYSGPVVADRDGNVFAVLSTASGEQEARGFAAPTIARGAGATSGVTLFKLPGAGTSLAALAPEKDASGLVAFQPTDKDTYAPLAPIALRYTLADGKVQAAGVPTPLLTLTVAGTAVSFISDDKDRLWVGVAAAGGGSTFVVLARR